MDDNLTIFLLMVVAIAAAAALTLLAPMLRAGKLPASGSGGDAGVPDETARLALENEQLRHEVGQLERQMRALEQVPADPAQRATHRTDALR